MSDKMSNMPQQDLVKYGRYVLKNFLNLFFPVLCAGCYKVIYDEEKSLCSTCRLKLPYLETMEEQTDLMQKFAGREQISYVYTYLYFEKKSLVQRLIHQLKYKGKKELGLELGKWFGTELKNNQTAVNSADMLIPVPIHPLRRQQRGYNQSEWIASGLALTLEIEKRDDIMRRTKFVGSQTNKNRMGRWQNVASVFEVIDLETVREKHVILIDDIITTGATLEACAIALREAGAKTVGVLTIAATR